MTLRRRRKGFAVASSLGAAAVAVVLLWGVGLTGTASAAITVPPFPGQAGAPVSGFDTYPWWLPQSAPGVDPISNVDTSEGSDATMYVMETISSLYNNAGIVPFSCTITKTVDADCEQPSNGSNPNNTQSDETDNFSGTVEVQSTNDVGSTNGQNELCNGSPAAPPGTTVDYARSSKPVSTSTCSTGVELGFAKDAVVAVDFQSIEPALYGTPSGYLDQMDPQCSSAGQYPSYAASNGAVTCTAFPSGGIGPVADGWLPTDPVNCGTGGGPACSGTPFSNISNTGISGGSGATSVAYRLFCQHGASSTPNTSQITDWGQLTNLSAANNGGTAQPVGDGAPIGVPIRIIGVNTGQATATTFYSFAQSGITSGTYCTDTSNAITTTSIDPNAASGPDPDANQGLSPNGSTNDEIALESDTSQIGDFAAANWPGDAADQATDIATSLYFMGYGVAGTNTNATEASLEGVTVPSGDPSTFTVKLLSANGITNTIPFERSNHYPMSRTFFNIYRTDQIRASTAGFLNWLCDSNTSIQKGTDHIDGQNFDTDLTDIINGEYGFSRLTDSTQEVATTTPADNVSGGGVDGTCDAQLPISSGATAGSSAITLASAPPASVAAGWPIGFQAGNNVTTPSGGDTISSISGSTINLASPLVVSSTPTGPTPSTLYFPGQAPILQINTPGS